MGEFVSTAYNRLDDDCGTAGCIAGWCAFLAAEVDVKKDTNRAHTKIEKLNDKLDRAGELVYTSWGDTADVAATWLGITSGQADLLFAPQAIKLDKVRKQDAIRMLQVLRDKGKITFKDWEDTLAMPIY
jgi:hypothetical protein